MQVGAPLASSLLVPLLSLRLHLLDNLGSQAGYNLGRRPASQCQTPSAGQFALRAMCSLGTTLVSLIQTHLGSLSVSQASCSLERGLGSPLQPRLALVSPQDSLLACSQTPASLSGSPLTAVRTPLAGRSLVQHSSRRSRASVAARLAINNSCQPPLLLLENHRLCSLSRCMGKVFRLQQCNRGLLLEEVLQLPCKHLCQVCQAA